MLEFEKLCHAVEKLVPADRVAMIAETALKVIDGLHACPISDMDPVETLAAFIIGSVVADGSISEKDYLHIYPSLEKAFGEACDLAGIETKFKVSRDVKKDISDYTQTLLAIIGEVDEELGSDIITLCLLVTSVDGKISMKEKHYIRSLCKV